MNIADIAAMLVGTGTLLTGIGALIRARLRPGDPARLEMRALKAEVRSLRRELALADANLEDARRDLREARKTCFEQAEQLSQAKTLIIALRKFLPQGGEWWERLGIPIDDIDGAS